MSMSTDRQMIRVLPLGGCMLATALAEPRRRYQVRNSFVDMKHDWPTCYSVHEALRTLQFYRGKLAIPKSLRQFCALPVDFDPISDGGERFEDAEITLLEPNTNLYHLFSGIPLTRTEIDRHILTPLRAVEGKVADAAVAWFTYGLMQCDEKVQEEAAGVLVTELEGRVDNPELARAILLETRSVSPDRDTYIAAIAELKETIRLPLGIVTFTFQYLANGRGLSWPPDFVESTMEAAKQHGIPCFHPAELVRKYGARIALKDDLRFYTPEFEVVIGEEMLKFCHAVAGRPSHSPDVAGNARQRTTPTEPQSMSEIYVPDGGLQGRLPLAYADLEALPLTPWMTVRASLSESTLPSPIPGVIARKLVEDLSPMEAATHDIRAHVANAAGARRFRVALVARFDERDQIRIWLGTGGPSGGRERVDAAIDLRSGSPIAVYTGGSNWRLVDVGSEELADAWRICWIVGEIETAVPDLFVLVTTSIKQGFVPTGDGKSGVWLGGLRVDALDDVEPRKVTGPSLEDNRRDLADLVSDEILSFLQEEFEVSGDLYQWYKTRYLPNKIGLSRIDREIANFVIRRFGATRKTLEVGAGVGQCSHLMALCGVHASGIEASSSHFDMMGRLTKRLTGRFDADLPTRFTPIRGFYPDDASPFVDERTIVIVPSLGSTLTPEQEVRIFDALREANGVILGMRMFFVTRESEEERQKMVEEIRKRGFGEPEVVLKWDDWSFGFAPDTIIFMPKS